MLRLPPSSQPEIFSNRLRKCNARATLMRLSEGSFNTAYEERRLTKLDQTRNRR